MFTPESAKFLLHVYGVPALVGWCFFAVGWSRGRKKEIFSNERRSWLDAIGLSAAYVCGHFALRPPSGFVPQGGADWLAAGMAAIAIVLGVFGRGREPGGRLRLCVGIIFLVTLGLMSGSLQGYAEVDLWKRIAVLAAFFAGALFFALGVALLAGEFRAGDFFVFTIILSGVGAVFVYTTGSVTMARLAAVPLAVSAAGLAVARSGKDFRVTPMYAFMTAMIFACVLCYSHFEAQESPPVMTLVLWMLSSSGAFSVFVYGFGGRAKWVYMLIVYCVMFAAAIAALAMVRGVTGVSD